MDTPPSTPLLGSFRANWAKAWAKKVIINNSAFDIEYWENLNFNIG